MIRVRSCFALASVAMGLVAACGGGAQPVESEFAFPLTDGTSVAPSSGSKSRSDRNEASDPNGLNDDQKEQIKVALRRGGEKARQCNSVAKATVSGEGEVSVVFDGTIGKSVDASVGSPFAGSAIEACVKRAFIDEIVLPFEGKLTVPYALKIEAPAPPVGSSKAKK